MEDSSNLSYKNGHKQLHDNKKHMAWNGQDLA
jgi:hypothetical protein